MYSLRQERISGFGISLLFELQEITGVNATSPQKNEI